MSITIISATIILTIIISTTIIIIIISIIIIITRRCSNSLVSIKSDLFASTQFSQLTFKSAPTNQLR